MDSRTVALEYLVVAYAEIEALLRGIDAALDDIDEIGAELDHLTGRSAPQTGD